MFVVVCVVAVGLFLKPRPLLYPPHQRDESFLKLRFAVFSVSQAVTLPSKDKLEAVLGICFVPSDSAAWRKPENTFLDFAGGICSAFIRLDERRQAFFNSHPSFGKWNF